MPKLHLRISIEAQALAEAVRVFWPSLQTRLHLWAAPAPQDVSLRLAEVRVISEENQVEARMGDIPAFSATPGEDGLMMVVYESTPSSLTYRDWAKFDAFIQHKDLGPIEEMHVARGLLKTDIKEAYHRYSKAVIGIGAAQGADQRFGLETEFVLLGNPYRDDPARFNLMGFLVQKPIKRLNPRLKISLRRPFKVLAIAQV